MKEIPKSSIQLNLKYQLIYLVKSIHCITKESINQNRKPNFFFLFWDLACVKISSLSENPFRLSENLLVWAKLVQRARAIFALATILSLGRKHFLAQTKHLSPGRNWNWEHFPGFQVTLPRRDCLAWAKICRKTSSIHYIRVIMHASDD